MNILSPQVTHVGFVVDQMSVTLETADVAQRWVQESWALVQQDSQRVGINLFLKIFEIAPAALQLFSFRGKLPPQPFGLTMPSWRRHPFSFKGECPRGTTRIDVEPKPVSACEWVRKFGLVRIRSSSSIATCRTINASHAI